MHEAAILLGAFSLISHVLGLVRDRLLAQMIGPSATLDIYYAAFQIPDLIYLSVASLASITVLMPFMVRALDSDGKEAARKFFNEVLSGFLLLLVIVCVIVFFLLPYIVHIIAPGFSEGELSELVKVSRIMLLSPIFLGLSNMIGTVTQLMRKFFIFSLSPLFYTLGIVVGVVFLYPLWGTTGLALGVGLGALMHLLIQLPTVVSAGFSPRISTSLERKTLKQVVVLALPRTLGLSMNSIAVLVIIAIGSTLAEGSISIFRLSYNLEAVFMGLIGISYAVAAFPLLTETYARGQHDRWQEGILTATRQIIFWSLPIAALLIVLRAQIVRVILGSGSFSWTDTRLAAATLALFAIGLVAQNMILVSVRAYYSANNTKTPLFINTFSAVVTIIGAFVLVHIFNTVPMFRYFMESLLRVEGIEGTAVLMLPLAYSIGTLLNAIMHWQDLKKKYLSIKNGLNRVMFESTAAAVIMGFVSYIMLRFFASVFDLSTFLGILFQGLASGIAGILVGMFVLYALKSEQFFEIMGALRRKFWKADFSGEEGD